MQGKLQRRLEIPVERLEAVNAVLLDPSMRIIGDIFDVVAKYGSLVVTLSEVASAIRLMAERNHVVAEGAGAVSVAAALAGKAGSGKIACVVSGGNLDTENLVQILQGTVPQ